eukprot:173745_1
MCILIVATLFSFFVAYADITFNIYNNSVFDGEPINTLSLSSLSYSIPYNTGSLSAQILGSILWEKSVDLYYFTCNFDSNLFGFVWIDDHLICAPNVYPPPIFAYWNLSYTSSAYNTRKSFIRIDLYSNSTSISNTKQQKNPIQSLDFSLMWSFNGNNSNNIINNTYLSKDISSPQKQRMFLQNNLTYNTFSTWYYPNILTLIRMPDSFGLTFGICSNSKTCETQQVIEDNQLWVGGHAYDHSYMEYNLSWNNYDLSYQYGSVIVNKTYSQFYAQIKLLSTKKPLPFIDFSSRFYWTRYGQYTSINTSNGDMNCFMKINGYGLSQYFEICSNIKTFINRNKNEYLFQFTENENIIYFTTDTSINSVNNIASIIDKLKSTEYNKYSKYGDLSDTKIGVQAGVMWNLIYSPEQRGPFNPVSRAWARASPPIPTDFVMIIFDWDNIFASYQLSLDALDIATSNLISVIKSKTVHGFVPNFISIGNKWSASTDRTEPVIGSMVLYKMYKKYGDNILWLIELLFDDLYDWLDWFWRRRRCQPKQLICLGSDPAVPDIDGQQNMMQGARWESGLDNSPMYDGEFFNATTHHMELYDVGMTAMFINELQRLTALGEAINVSSDVIRTLNERYSFMVNATLNELWDDSNGIFVNKFSRNDTFYFRISPTSFYPLMSGEPTVKQAEMMVTNYLLSPDYFCISETWPNNQSDECYYGLPSISRNDPAFKSQNYWRGLTWGPMSQLVWWSLDEYVDQSDIVKNGQNALMKQMNAMMLNVWNNKRHICENYSPSKDHTECTGVHFYHWGGLSGFLSLIHDYY